MAIFPLSATSTHPDAWHQVRAPGGYEWWYFDAEDPQHDRQLVAILFQGFVFHPQYLRRYFRYHRRPTRFTPPLPAEYPCAYFALYEAGRVRRQFMTQYPPAAFDAAADEPRVSLGDNRFTFDGSKFDLQLEGTPWRLTGRGPRLRPEQLMARLSFSPRLSHAPLERIFLSRQLSGASHHWIVANPLCDVSGTIRFGLEQIQFTGSGYHDHNWGTAPLGPGLHRWLWGRVLLEDRAFTFHYAHPRDPALPDEIHLIEATTHGIREIPILRVDANWSGRTRLLLDYPQRLALDDVLELTNPRIIDLAPFYMRLKYDVARSALFQCSHGQWNGARASAQPPTALCEIAYPHRLRWPLLGRMIEMSIDKRF